MTAAPMVARGTTLEAGSPISLFQTHIFGGGVDLGQGPQYAVHGDRFLINVLDDESTPIRLIQNWQPSNSNK